MNIPNAGIKSITKRQSRSGHISTACYRPFLKVTMKDY